MKFLQILQLFDFSGKKTYAKYLSEMKTLKKMPLSKKEFFAQKEDKKWKKINRCC